MIIFLLISACAAPARRTPGDTATLAVTIELDSDGSARITERLRMTAQNADAACGFCGREFVSSFEQAAAVRPVPVLIEAMASFFSFLGGVLGSLGLLLGVVFFVIGVTGGDSFGESALIALFAMVVP